MSFYFGDAHNFAWALQKSGPIAFAAIPLTAAEMETPGPAEGARCRRGIHQPNAGFRCRLEQGLVELVRTADIEIRHLVDVFHVGIERLPQGGNLAFHLRGGERYGSEGDRT